MRTTLLNPMDVPGVLSGLGLHPNEAVVLGELVRLLGAKLVEGEPVREATPVGVACVKTPFDHVWFWKTKLPERKGQRCRVLARGAMNTILVEFEDGKKVTTGRYAVRPVTSSRRSRSGSAGASSRRKS